MGSSVLVWTVVRRGRNHESEAPGRGRRMYVVGRREVDGVVTWVAICVDKGSSPWTSEHLGHHSDAPAAKDACQEHHTALVR